MQPPYTPFAHGQLGPPPDGGAEAGGVPIPTLAGATPYVPAPGLRRQVQAQSVLSVLTMAKARGEFDPECPKRFWARVYM